MDMNALKEILKSEMKKMLDRDFMTFQCGMAVGGDLLFAEIALELKREYAPMPIRFVAVVPCLNHDKSWNEADRLRLREISEEADDIVLVSNSRYYDGCMAKRNRYLVDNCDELIAIFDGQRGGTMQTINYAKEKRRRITIIDPSKSVKITLIEPMEMRE